ncbi:MAG: tetratricopeptide repeat protein [Myxococcales bacterium]|nr:tetratricopeptide repeat protein [Myxococcota bacterium]MDW8280407.1 tetratricopeptide repeat protein [Myxococcales bacterium]
MSAHLARHYYLRGRDKLGQGSLEDACQDMQAAIQLCPAFCEARLGYATALMRLGEAARAVQTLRAGLHYAAVSAERAALLRALSDALIMQEDFAGAEQALDEAMATGLQSADLHDRLARLRARTGRFAESFAELLRAAQLAR